MKKKLQNAILFPGQGSQFKGMGQGLFSKYLEMTEKASNILGYSVEELCLEDPESKLDLTQYTQPALYVVNTMCYLEMRENRPDLSIDYLLGHSLGEYNALWAAKVFDFETGVRLVQKRGQLMSEAQEGAMGAILNIEINQVLEILEKENLSRIDIANYNTPTQLVLSGPKEDIEGVEVLIERNKGNYIPLRVSTAFHSRMMNDSEQKFKEFLKNFSFKTPEIPIIANVTARPYTNGNITELMTSQITGSVHWVESIVYLIKDNEIDFVEVYGNRLSHMIKQIKKYDLNKIVFLEKNTKKNRDKKISKVKSVKLKKIEGNKSRKENKVKKDCQNVKKNSNKGMPVFKLGNKDFCHKYGLMFPYVAGAMYRGISSKDLVVQMGKSRLIGYLGTGGMSLSEIAENIDYIQATLNKGQPYGMNLLCNPLNENLEQATVALYLEKEVRFIEAAAFINITKNLVWYRAAGFRRDENGLIESNHHILAKCSHPEVAKRFMSPPSHKHLKTLVAEGKISPDQAEMAVTLPMSNEICVEADSGGHTDMGLPNVLFPAFRILSKEILSEFNYSESIYLGLAGGIGSPESVVAAFMLGADFVLTGSINQCTPQAGQSDVVKDILAFMDVQDTDYAPAGDMFEMGAKIQVLKRGIFFPARAKFLYQLYVNYNGLDEIPDTIKNRLETQFFKKSIEEVWMEVKQYFQAKELQNQIDLAMENPKHKMALVFRWYFGYSSKVTQQGDLLHKVDFQIHTGPALGAFNQWVKNTELENWRKRDVDVVAKKLMFSAQEYFDKFQRVYQSTEK